MSPKVIFAVYEVVIEAAHVDRNRPADELISTAEAYADNVAMTDALLDCAREALDKAGLSGKLIVRVAHV